MKKIYDFDVYLFDMDGTLVDSMPIWNEIYEKTLTALGAVAARGYADEINRMTMRDAADYTVRRYAPGATADEVIALWRGFAAEAYRTRVGLKPGVREFLAELKKRGKKLGIATALEKDMLIPCLEANQIDGYFDAFTPVSEVGRSKDFADVYIRACEKLNGTPGNCVVFEDDITAVGTAKSAGFYTVAVYDGAQGRPAAVADRCIAGYAELIGE